MSGYALAAVLVLAAVHLLAGRLRFLDGTPRSIWLSMAGGVSVAYVFLHLLPELAEAQKKVLEAGGLFRLLERHVYLVALAGLALFYGLERMARCSAERPSHEKASGDETRIFWIHFATFAVYNVVIGYLLVERESRGLSGLVLFTIAMGLHFVVTDYSLRESYKSEYVRVGRYVLALAVACGWLLGSFAQLPEVGLSMLVAFLAGGIVLNVLKEELPQERQSRFWAFLIGTCGYAALLIAA